MKSLIEIDVLLIMRADQVMKGVSGYRKHRHAVAFRVIQTIQKMNSARSGGGDTHTQLSRVFRIAARRKSCCFLMPDLDELDFFLPCPKRLEHTVNAISRKAKNHFHSPIEEPVGE